MSRFGVYKNPQGAGYLLDIQAELLSHFNTRVVVPLLPSNEAPTPAATLNPVIEIDGVSYSMATQYLAAVPEKVLKNKVATLENRRDEITAAIDLLFYGF